MCTSGKVEFPTIKAVRTALNKARRSGRQRRHEQSFYRCAGRYGCGNWHLTSDPPKKGQRFT